MQAALQPKFVLLVLLGLLAASPARGEDLAVVFGVQRQPLVAATERLIEALEFSGSPLDPAVVESNSRSRQAGGRKSGIQGNPSHP